ncbi:Thioredoxin reductase [Lachnellula hyalina]|uniref:Thioredoxin reductase n=1 Tax=Lachnellula hyalina TaxID=1316788 RepID=A0A8H8QU44_9HELO|nr:Thioredoxin reductase [Lachnellula hyalina]TVY22561.1 Thioredoxin reductase [Lachnellula hyalina]
MSDTIQDVLIIGAGPAGLSAALTLAYQCHTASVFDTKQYRTDSGQSSPQINVLSGWDGRTPQEYRSTARQEIAAYNTVTFHDTEIVSISRNAQGIFEGSDGSGKLHKGRKIILAHGVREEYPDIPGYGECWAKGILHCLFCHGYDVRDSPSSGVLAVDWIAMPPFTLHMAHMAAQLSHTVIIYTHGNPDLGLQLTGLCSPDSPWKTDDRRISALEMESLTPRRIRISFEDGSSVVEPFLAHAPRSVLRGTFAEQLGIGLTSSGEYDISGSKVGETSVEGVYAAGDCATVFKVAPNAVASGSVAGSGVAIRIQEEKHGIKSIMG